MMIKVFAYFALVLASTFLVSGCTTRTKAQLKAQQAFIAGQQQAMAQMQQQQQPGNVVQIIGEVQHQQIAWNEGLTLAEAIVASEFRGARDPQEIIIYRHGQAIAINPKALLRGEDELLQPGDRIILR